MLPKIWALNLNSTNDLFWDCNKICPDDMEMFSGDNGPGRHFQVIVTIKPLFAGNLRLSSKCHLKNGVL